MTWVPFLINSGTEALKYAQTTETTAVAFGWKNVDHATNRHFIEAWTSEADNYSRGEDRGTRMALPSVGAGIVAQEMGHKPRGQSFSDMRAAL